MSRVAYTAFIRQSDSGYWADCPDLPGCIAFGETIAEARAQFADALHFHLNALKNHDPRYRLPHPRDREQILAEEADPYLMAWTVIVEEPAMTQ